MLPFVFWAVLLGVAGNMLLDVGKSAYSKWKPDGPVNAICVKAGEEFVLPKQECGPVTKTDSARGRAGVQVLKKE